MIKNKSKKLTALLLAGVLATSCFVGGTFARYVTSTSSEDSARVAVWGINADDVEMDLFDGSYTVGGVLVADSEDDDNIIAPGTKKDNYFSIVNLDENLKPEVMYEVAINLDDSEIDQRILDNPSIQWRLDEGNYGTWEETKAQILALSGDASGVKTYDPLEIAENFKADVKHKIGWQWIMDNNNNVMDTEMGNAATRGDITAKISIKVTATQVNVDTTGMLGGNGSVFNRANPTILTFRSSAPVDELVSVEINGTTLTQNTDYTVSEGSTIITLNKNYLSSLNIGNYTISIISDNITVNGSFSVINETVGEPTTTPIVHNNVIPEGGVYYSNVTATRAPADAEFGIYTFNEEDINFERKYVAGENFPMLRTGDVYIYDGLEYRYNMEYEIFDSFENIEEDIWTENTTLNGWGAKATDQYRTYYYNILTTINGADLISLKNAFYASSITSMSPIPSTVKSLKGTFSTTFRLTTAPVIPNGVIDMTSTFEKALRLTTAPVIPETVTKIFYTFKDSSVSGTIELNSTNIEGYKYMFGISSSSDPITLTNPIILTGTSPYLEEIAELYTNVTVQR